MQVTLEVPEDAAFLLGENPSRAALEALVMEGVRTAKVSAAAGAALLGFSRYEMDGFLKAHEVFLPLTIEEINSDAQTLHSFLTK